MNVVQRARRPGSLLRPTGRLPVAGLALAALAALALASSAAGGPVAATGGPGAIWTTNAGCVAQDLNHYVVGDDVHVRGRGFPAGTTLAWTVMGQPGGASSDPGLVVAAGTVVTDAAGAFCARFYTVQPGDRGEYTVDVAGARKNDNYRVRAAAPTAPPTEPPAPEALLVVTKLLDLDANPATTGAADRVPAPGWRFDIAVAGGTPRTAHGSTGSSGSVAFRLFPGESGAVVDVEEALPRDVEILAASCTGPDGARGTASLATGAVLDVAIAAEETVRCTFVNTSGTVSPATARPKTTPPATAGPGTGDDDGVDWRPLVIGFMGLLALLELLAPARLLRVLAR